MNLREIYSGYNKQSDKSFSAKKQVISFEIFPPKDDYDGIKLQKLLGHLKLLKKYNPSFISLTYGAGGTNQTNSLEIIKHIKQDLDLKVMPHFTCVGSSKEQVTCYLEEIQNLGIENILALRGDIPDETNQPNLDFKYANELVSFIKSKTELAIGVAGYPEGHIDCEDLFSDIKNLKRKVDAGADAIYTQMFFDNDKFFKFLELTNNADIKAPIIPGILPIMNYKQFERMLSMARVSVPKPLMAQLEKYKENSDDIKKVGIEFASSQCQQLIDAQIEGLHFFTLNTSSSLCQILDNIGI